MASFHSKLGRFLVELELKALAERRPCLGVDLNNDSEPITWDMLFDHWRDHPFFFPPTLPRAPARRPPPPSEELPVAIVGGGVTGLRVAMMLETLQIPYKLFEVSERIGGRAFTYHFKHNDDEASTTQNYFDVGAMRFPDNAVNASLFALFAELHFTKHGREGNKLIPYHLQSPDNILLFNGIKKTVGEVNEHPGKDHFNDGKVNGGQVPMKYITKEYRMPDGTKLYGADACLEAAYGPFKDELTQDFQTGWISLMKYDHHSTRSYLNEVMKYPWSVVQWMERSDAGTGGFDCGFAESILDSLEFDYPAGVHGEPGPIEWWCIEGGTDVLTKAMHASLKHKESIQTRKRVTHIARVTKQPADLKVIEIDLPVTGTVMEVRVEDATTEHVTAESTPPSFDTQFYSHVVSTVPFACLRSIDLGRCNLDYQQEMALRSLQHGSAVKVGIKFKTRWWQGTDLSKAGGSSKTDRQSRVVVYPNYGLDSPVDTPGVLMATYNWDQDAIRYGSLIDPKDWTKVLDPKRNRSAAEEFLLRQIFTDLAELHGQNPTWYREQMIDYYAYDWCDNPFTVGAFASFGPGQFKNLYPSVSKPASDGYLHFGGEVASYHHGWIAGALDSAWRCVYEILAKSGTDEQKELFRTRYGNLKEFDDVYTAAGQYFRGIYANSLEKPEGNDDPFKY